MVFKKNTIMGMLVMAVLISPQAMAKGGDVECRMNFNLKSWSFLYKSGKGDGTITCSNGQMSVVKLRGKGGGLTAGKSKIMDGLGVFSSVSDISELYGNYASAEAHAGAVSSVSARVLTKGEVSLTLTGTGKGVDLGVNFGNFKISKK